VAVVRQNQAACEGCTLRHRPGILFRTNSQFGNAFATGLTIAGALGGTIVVTTPATVTLELPSGVSEKPHQSSGTVVWTRWKLGAPPLKDTG
jgi:hypothetical protein